MSRVTVSQLDEVLSPATTVQYWKDDKRQYRPTISPSAAVIAIEHDQVFIKGQLTNCIIVYVGEEVIEHEDIREPDVYKRAIKQLKEALIKSTCTDWRTDFSSGKPKRRRNTDVFQGFLAQSRRKRCRQNVRGDLFSASLNIYNRCTMQHRKSLRPATLLSQQLKRFQKGL